MRAAFYESDITPPLGGYMVGYYMKRIAEDVFEKLYAKAVVIEDEGKYAAIVDVDICMLTPEMHDIVTKRIFEYTGIRPECVCVSANHTHRGAPISDSFDIQCFADNTYKDVFYRLVADAVILAYKRLGDESVTVKYGKVKAEGLAFSRNGVLKDGRYITHPRGRADFDHVLGTTDPDLTLLYFEKNGKPIGSIVNFALHQDTAGEDIGYTGDYASVLSEYLKDKFGRNFVSLFMMGTCGDINHVNPDPNETRDQYPYCGHRIIGKKIFEHVEGMLDNPDNLEEVSGSVESIKESVVIERRTYDGSLLEETEEHLKKYANPTLTLALLAYRLSNPPATTEVYVQVIKIGDVVICALPGENYVRIGLDIKAASGYGKTIVATNCNTYLGYIPTKDCFVENSVLYEMSVNGYVNLVPEAAEILTEKSLEMIKKV